MTANQTKTAKKSEERDAAPVAPPFDHATQQDIRQHDCLHPRPAIRDAAFGHACGDYCYATFGIIRLGTAIYAVRVKSRVDNKIVGYEPLGEAVAMFTHALTQVRTAVRFHTTPFDQNFPKEEEGKN